MSRKITFFLFALLCLSIPASTNVSAQDEDPTTATWTQPIRIESSDLNPNEFQSIDSVEYRGEIVVASHNELETRILQIEEDNGIRVDEYSVFPGEKYPQLVLQGQFLYLFTIVQESEFWQINVRTNVDFGEWSSIQTIYTEYSTEPPVDYSASVSIDNRIDCVWSTEMTHGSILMHLQKENYQSTEVNQFTPTNYQPFVNHHSPTLAWYGNSLYIAWISNIFDDYNFPLDVEHQEVVFVELNEDGFSQINSLSNMFTHDIDPEFILNSNEPTLLFSSIRKFNPAQETDIENVHNIWISNILEKSVHMLPKWNTEEYGPTGTISGDNISVIWRDNTGFFLSKTGLSIDDSEQFSVPAAFEIYPSQIDERIDGKGYLPDLTISNTGQITIEGELSATDNLQLQLTDFVLHPGEEITFWINFDSESIGPHYESVTVETNHGIEIISVNVFVEEEIEIPDIEIIPSKNKSNGLTDFGTNSILGILIILLTSILLYIAANKSLPPKKSLGFVLMIIVFITVPFSDIISAEDSANDQQLYDPDSELAPLKEFNVLPTPFYNAESNAAQVTSQSAIVSNYDNNSGYDYFIDPIMFELDVQYPINNLIFEEVVHGGTNEVWIHVRNTETNQEWKKKIHDANTLQNIPNKNLKSPLTVNTKNTILDSRNGGNFQVMIFALRPAEADYIYNDKITIDAVEEGSPYSDISFDYTSGTDPHFDDKTKCKENEEFKITNETEGLDFNVDCEVGKTPIISANDDSKYIITTVNQNLNVKAWSASATFTTIAEGKTYSAGDTTLTVANSAGFAFGDIIQIGDELLQISEVNGKDLTVVRGYDVTTDVDHSNGSRVTLLLSDDEKYELSFNANPSFPIAMKLVSDEFDLYFRPDSDFPISMKNSDNEYADPDLASWKPLLTSNGNEVNIKLKVGLVPAIITYNMINFSTHGTDRFFKFDETIQISTVLENPYPYDIPGYLGIYAVELDNKDNVSPILMSCKYKSLEKRQKRIQINSFTSPNSDKRDLALIDTGCKGTKENLSPDKTYYLIADFIYIGDNMDYNKKSISRFGANSTHIMSKEIASSMFTVTYGDVISDVIVNHQDWNLEEVASDTIYILNPNDAPGNLDVDPEYLIDSIDSRYKQTHEIITINSVQEFQNLIINPDYGSTVVNMMGDSIPIPRNYLTGSNTENRYLGHWIFEGTSNNPEFVLDQTFYRNDAKLSGDLSFTSNNQFGSTSLILDGDQSYIAISDTAASIIEDDGKYYISPRGYSDFDTRDAKIYDDFQSALRNSPSGLYELQDTIQFHLSTNITQFPNTGLQSLAQYRYDETAGTGWKIALDSSGNIYCHYYIENHQDPIVLESKNPIQENQWISINLNVENDTLVLDISGNQSTYLLPNNHQIRYRTNNSTTDEGTYSNYNLFIGGSESTISTPMLVERAYISDSILETNNYTPPNEFDYENAEHWLDRVGDFISENQINFINIGSDPFSSVSNVRSSWKSKTLHLPNGFNDMVSNYSLPANIENCVPGNLNWAANVIDQDLANVSVFDQTAFNKKSISSESILAYGNCSVVERYPIGKGSMTQISLDFSNPMYIFDSGYALTDIIQALLDWNPEVIYVLNIDLDDNSGVSTDVEHLSTTFDEMGQFRIVEINDMDDYVLLIDSNIRDSIIINANAKGNLPLPDRYVTGATVTSATDALFDFETIKFGVLEVTNNLAANQTSFPVKIEISNNSELEPIETFRMIENESQYASVDNINKTYDWIVQNNSQMTAASLASAINRYSSLISATAASSQITLEIKPGSGISPNEIEISTSNLNAISFTPFNMLVPIDTSPNRVVGQIDGVPKWSDGIFGHNALRLDSDSFFSTPIKAYNLFSIDFWLLSPTGHMPASDDKLWDLSCLGVDSTTGGILGTMNLDYTNIGYSTGTANYIELQFQNNNAYTAIVNGFEVISSQSISIPSDCQLSFSVGESFRGEIIVDQIHMSNGVATKDLTRNDIDIESYMYDFTDFIDLNSNTLVIDYKKPPNSLALSNNSSWNNAFDVFDITKPIAPLICYKIDDVYLAEYSCPNTYDSIQTLPSDYIGAQPFCYNGEKFYFGVDSCDGYNATVSKTRKTEFVAYGLFVAYDLETGACSMEAEFNFQCLTTIFDGHRRSSVYSPENLTLTKNTASANLPLVPSITGSEDITSWAINASLPSGLSFGSNNGTIYGTPTELWPRTSYKVSADNAGDPVVAYFNLTVKEEAKDLWNYAYTDMLSGDLMVPKYELKLSGLNELFKDDLPPMFTDFDFYDNSSSIPPITNNTRLLDSLTNFTYNQGYNITTGNFLQEYPFGNGMVATTATDCPHTNNEFSCNGYLLSPGRSNWMYSLSRIVTNNGDIIGSSVIELGQGTLVTSHLDFTNPTDSKFTLMQLIWATKSEYTKIYVVPKSTGEISKEVTQEINDVEQSINNHGYFDINYLKIDETKTLFNPMDAMVMHKSSNNVIVFSDPSDILLPNSLMADKKLNYGFSIDAQMETGNTFSVTDMKNPFISLNFASIEQTNATNAYRFDVTTDSIEELFNEIDWGVDSKQKEQLWHAAANDDSNKIPSSDIELSVYCNNAVTNNRDHKSWSLSQIAIDGAVFMLEVPTNCANQALIFKLDITVDAGKNPDGHNINSYTRSIFDLEFNSVKACTGTSLGYCENPTDMTKEFYENLSFDPNSVKTHGFDENSVRIQEMQTGVPVDLAVGELANWAKLNGHSIIVAPQNQQPLFSNIGYVNLESNFEQISLMEGIDGTINKGWPQLASKSSGILEYSTTKVLDVSSLSLERQDSIFSDHLFSNGFNQNKMQSSQIYHYIDTLSSNDVHSIIGLNDSDSTIGAVRALIPLQRGMMVFSGDGDFSSSIAFGILYTTNTEIVRQKLGTFAKGETVQFKVTVDLEEYNNTSSSDNYFHATYLLSLESSTNNGGEEIIVDNLHKSLENGGKYTLYLSWNIPSDAAIGNYGMKVTAIDTELDRVASTYGDGNDELLQIEVQSLMYIVEVSTPSMVGAFDDVSIDVIVYNAMSVSNLIDVSINFKHLEDNTILWVSSSRPTMCRAKQRCKTSIIWDDTSNFAGQKKEIGEYEGDVRIDDFVSRYQIVGIGDRVNNHQKDALLDTNIFTIEILPELEIVLPVSSAYWKVRLGSNSHWETYNGGDIILTTEKIDSFDIKPISNISSGDCYDSSTGDLEIKYATSSSTESYLIYKQRVQDTDRNIVGCGSDENVMRKLVVDKFQRDGTPYIISMAGLEQNSLISVGFTPSSSMGSLHTNATDSTTVGSFDYWNDADNKRLTVTDLETFHSYEGYSTVIDMPEGTEGYYQFAWDERSSSNTTVKVAVMELDLFTPGSASSLFGPYFTMIHDGMSDLKYYHSSVTKGQVNFYLPAGKFVVFIGGNWSTNNYTFDNIMFQRGGIIDSPPLTHCPMGGYNTSTADKAAERSASNGVNCPGSSHNDTDNVDTKRDSGAAHSNLTVNGLSEKGLPEELMKMFGGYQRIPLIGNQAASGGAPIPIGGGDIRLEKFGLAWENQSKPFASNLVFDIKLNGKMTTEAGPDEIIISFSITVEALIREQWFTQYCDSNPEPTENPLWSHLVSTSELADTIGTLSSPHGCDNLIENDHRRTQAEADLINELGFLVSFSLSVDGIRFPGGIKDEVKLGKHTAFKIDIGTYLYLHFEIGFMNNVMLCSDSNTQKVYNALYESVKEDCHTEIKNPDAISMHLDVGFAVADIYEIKIEFGLGNKIGDSLYEKSAAQMKLKEKYEEQWKKEYNEITRLNNERKNYIKGCKNLDPSKTEEQCKNKWPHKNKLVEQKKTTAQVGGKMHKSWKSADSSKSWGDKMHSQRHEPLKGSIEASLVVGFLFNVDVECPDLGSGDECKVFLSIEFILNLKFEIKLQLFKICIFGHCWTPSVTLGFDLRLDKVIYSNQLTGFKHDHDGPLGKLMFCDRSADYKFYGNESRQIKSMINSWNPGSSEPTKYNSLVPMGGDAEAKGLASQKSEFEISVYWFKLHWHIPDIGCS